MTARFVICSMALTLAGTLTPVIQAAPPGSVYVGPDGTVSVTNFGLYGNVYVDGSGEVRTSGGPPTSAMPPTPPTPPMPPMPPMPAMPDMPPMPDTSSTTYYSSPPPPAGPEVTPTGTGSLDVKGPVQNSTIINRSTVTGGVHKGNTGAIVIDGKKY